MNDFRDLYQETILEHAKRPRNFHTLEGAAVRLAHGHNPLCGDRLVIALDIQGGTIADAAFQGTGCAISMASASIMTELIKGKTPEEVEGLFQRFHEIVTGEGSGADIESAGKLAVFQGVHDYPARVKCASLAWHAMRSALDRAGEVVSTE